MEGRTGAAASTRAQRRSKTIGCLGVAIVGAAALACVAYSGEERQISDLGLRAASVEPLVVDAGPAALPPAGPAAEVVASASFAASAASWHPSAPAALLGSAAPASASDPSLVTPAAPAATTAPTSGAAAPAAIAHGSAAAGGYRAKYGFYIHAFDHPPAVIYQVRQVKKFFPDSPIYIMTDGGWNFEELCKKEGCKFKGCPPANDRWHPWPFFHRMHEAAVWLNTEYVIMLEPDNTIHGPITRQPTHDAGGLFVNDRSFGYKEWAEEQAHKIKPGFEWRRRSMNAGFCGGSYYRTAAVLDAFSDEAVAALDWNFLAEKVTKEVFSSDFAMPYLLAVRGYDAEPWDDAAQMEQDKDVPHTGPADAAFRHYGGGYPGGKPTYNMQLQPEDRNLAKPGPPVYNKWWTNCQICWDLERYKQRYGTEECANPIPFKYSKWLLERYKNEYTWGLR